MYSLVLNVRNNNLMITLVDFFPQDKKKNSKWKFFSTKSAHVGTNFIIGIDLKNYEKNKNDIFCTID